MGKEYKGMSDLRRIISAQTYLAVRVINGSDWAENGSMSIGSMWSGAQERRNGILESIHTKSTA